MIAFLAASTRTERDDLFRIGVFDDGPDAADQRCIGRRLHRLIGAEFDAETTSGERVPYVEEVEPPEVPVMSVEPPHPVEAEERG